MKEITGNLYNTNNGQIIVPESLNDIFRIGDKVQFDGKEYNIQQVIPPSVPNGKWSFKVD